MPISEEEKQEIIDAAVEKALLLLPETVGALMANQASFHKLTREFYAKYPEFKDHKKLVASVVEKVEGSSPLAKYDKILEKAVPEIRKRINTLGSVDTDTVTTNPNRQFEPLESPKINPNGVI